MAKALLINPDYYEGIFGEAKVKGAISRGTTVLGLACLGGSLIRSGHDVRILDLNISDNPEEKLKEELKGFNPHYVGLTSTTPVIKKCYSIVSVVKKYDPDIKVALGGPHPSALPMDVLSESATDFVVIGEGEYVFDKIVGGENPENINNICYKRPDGEIARSQIAGEMITDLDALAYPAYQLYDISKYYQPKISSRKDPLGYIETSRGCYAKCTFCNKNIHGMKVRMKSSARVLDEMERMLKFGFREIHIIDDIFTADMKRAHEICEMILSKGLKFPWYPRGGIRVEKVSPELLRIMKKAGCYRIPFGIESGSQRVIDVVNKKITLERAEQAVRMAKEAGIEVECYFMLGLPTETEEDIKASIDFALKLDPDYVKFAITIPLPGTPMYDQMKAKGQIKTDDWDKYNFATPPKDLYEHDTLSWETIDKYYQLAHRRFYLRPGYILRMIFKTIRNGTFLGHVKAFLQTRW